MTFAYKPVFIVGHPRSGTTWTMWNLAQHPEIAASFHSGFIHSLSKIEAWQHNSGSFGKFIIPSISANSNPFVKQGKRQVPWEAAISPSIFERQMRAMVCNLFDTIAAYGNNPKVVVENTPENMEFMNWLLDIVPEAYILHVIRDPRSIWSSVRHSLHSWMNPNSISAFPYSLSENLLRWRRYITISRDIKMRTNNYAEVKYESLKRDGVNELLRIFNWLGLTVNKDFCEQALKNTTLNNLKQMMPSPEGFFNKGKIDSWQQSLSKSEIKQIEYLVGDLMDELGYCRQYPDITSPPWQLRFNNQLSRAAKFVKRRLYRW